MITVENIDKQGRMSMSLESFLLKKERFISKEPLQTN